MMPKEVNRLESIITQLEESITESSDTYLDTDSLYNEASEICEGLVDYPFEKNGQILFNGLVKRLKKLKTDLDIYDADAEFDTMYPNGQDED